MKRFLAILGRQPKISLAELESLYENVRPLGPSLAEFELGADSPRDETGNYPAIQRLGGTIKIAEPITEPLAEFWKKLPETGKIVLGVSDFSRRTNPYLAQKEALRWKRVIGKTGRNVRVIPNKTAVLSSATSQHNRLWTATHIELIKNDNKYYRVVGVQNIDAYTQRDQARPARDAKVGMLPPKLAQILINLCGKRPKGATLLDPFCGTGVVLQEAGLMGYAVKGSDLNERMVEYTKRNLDWAYKETGTESLKNYSVEQGDARSTEWQAPIDLVACETYLGQPMSLAPAEIKLKQEKQECGSIILGFLKNLAEQIEAETPVVIAVPAWLRPDGHYERLNLLDEIRELRYNVVSFKNLEQRDLLYHREGQVVAREIIVLRKK